MSTDEVIEKLSDLRPFIAYLENTREDEWQVNTVRNVGNTKNCVMGHLVNWFYGKEFEGNISPAWDWFEEMWTTTYVIYGVNDGTNLKYRQPTPKQRVLAYLENLWLGLEEDTQTGMERSYREWQEREAKNVATTVS